MLRDPKVVEHLNTQLTNELTAINQYFLHARILQHWGVTKLGKHEYDESIEEMKHADELIERILYLDGIPNLQRLGAVRVGQDAVEMHQLDLDLEREAVARLNKTIAVCLDKRDAGTRELLEHVLGEEEESIEWLEAQFSIIKDIGRERYLSEQLRE